MFDARSTCRESHKLTEERKALVKLRMIGKAKILAQIDITKKVRQVSHRTHTSRSSDLCILATILVQESHLNF